MRLIRTSNLELCRFEEGEIPEYVILSHTWGPEEVSFQSFGTADAKDLAGYGKIEQCCQVAFRDGWSYVWIDTCCIDKTSSAELSEAINSMFRWYQEAQVCYTYLSDVSVARELSGDCKSLDQKHKFSVKDSFSSSRWFRRGWTLQELLAPWTMVFYDKNWNEIGTKWSLQQEISRITAISTDHIANPRSASVAAKMSWASRRQTRRPEDISYCLMGLFDVNMPLLYGEGSKAFMRLQLEIVKSSNDESIFAWKDASLRYSGMFAQSPAAFSDSGNIIPITVPIAVPNLGRSSFEMTYSGVTISTIITARKIDERTESDEADHPLQSVQLQCARNDADRRPIVLMLKSAGPFRWYNRRRPNAFMPFDESKPRIGVSASVYIPHHFEKLQGIRRVNRDQHFMIDHSISRANFTLKGTSLTRRCHLTPQDQRYWRLLIEEPYHYGALRFTNTAAETFILIVTTVKDGMPSIDLMIPTAHCPISALLKDYGVESPEVFSASRTDRLSRHLQHETHIFVALRKRVHDGQVCHFVDIELRNAGRGGGLSTPWVPPSTCPRCPQVSSRTKCQDDSVSRLDVLSSQDSTSSGWSIEESRPSDSTD